jgi:hypothetical protein
MRSSILVFSMYLEENRAPIKRCFLRNLSRNNVTTNALPVRLEP